jgi:acyl-coenzyme A thioesterase PaaI-like protein
MPSSPLESLTAAIRQLIALAVAQDLPEQEVLEATGVVRAVAERLEATARGPRPRPVPQATSDPDLLFPTSPAVGRQNPVAPEVHLWREGQGIAGRAVIGPPYEGPPTCVHGGVLALLFDELLGLTNMVAGTPGMTGTLTVRYRQPTPLRRPLSLSARQVSVEGRKIRSRAEITAGGAPTAQAEGLFVAVDAARFEALVARHAEHPTGTDDTE